MVNAIFGFFANIFQAIVNFFYAITIRGNGWPGFLTSISPCRRPR